MLRALPVIKNTELRKSDSNLFMLIPGGGLKLLLLNYGIQGYLAYRTQSNYARKLKYKEIVESCYKQEAIKPIKQAAMAGQNGARVFYIGITLKP